MAELGSPGDFGWSWESCSQDSLYFLHELERVKDVGDGGPTPPSLKPQLLGEGRATASADVQAPWGWVSRKPFFLSCLAPPSLLLAWSHPCASRLWSLTRFQGHFCHALHMGQVSVPDDDSAVSQEPAVDLALVLVGNRDAERKSQARPSCKKRLIM